jgi:hypothetical protein
VFVSLIRPRVRSIRFVPFFALSIAAAKSLPGVICSVVRPSFVGNEIILGGYSGFTVTLSRNRGYRAAFSFKKKPPCTISKMQHQL